MMKKILFIVLISVIVSCQNNSKTISDTSHNTESTNKKEQQSEVVIGNEFKLDDQLNPFLSQKDDEKLNPCSKKGDIETIFKCVVGQFREAQIPIQVGPIPEPYFEHQQSLEDSLFIVRCLHDTTFYAEPPEDRVYGYYNGKIIDRTENYILCLILFSFNVGFEYHLCSFKPSGELISKKIIGAQASDWYEIYGFVNDKKSFELHKNEFDYRNDKLFIKNKLMEKYRILDNGVFIRK